MTPRIMCRVLGSVLGLLLVSACAPDDPVQHVECKRGDVRETPCGSFGNGVQQQHCVDFFWVDEGFCIEHNDCVAGTAQTVTCGLNDRGAQTQRCTAGFWEDEGTCADIDICTDGDEAFVACGIEEAGSLRQECEQGQWADADACAEVYDCHESATDVRSCGLNGRGEQSRPCLDLHWAEEYGRCQDPDVCTDGLIERAICFGEEGGLNGSLERTRECVGGHWTAFGECKDPHVCTTGAVETVVCGEDQSGTRERACVDGAWTSTSPCYQTVDALFAAPRGLFFLPRGQNNPFAVGDNEYGTLNAIDSPGDASPFPMETLSPSPLDSNDNGTGRFAAGYAHQCAIAPDGRLFCWGDNSVQQLGAPPNARGIHPTVGNVGAVEVSLPQPVAQVVAGDDFSCARLTNGRVYCWGRNDEYQLGLGHSSPSEGTPAQVMGGRVFARLAAGSAHVCAATESEIYCWGRNVEGQASPTGADAITRPTLHAGLTKEGSFLGSTYALRHLAAGRRHTLALWHESRGLGLARQLTLHGVGDSARGQLGVVTTSPVRTAATVYEGPSGLTAREPISVISAGDVTCLNDEADQVGWRCVGDNRNGQLSDVPGEAISSFSPVPSDLAVAGVAAVSYVLTEGSLCAVLADDRVRCRGANDAGQLGDGTFISRRASDYLWHRDQDEP